MKETRICTNCGAEHPIETMYQVEGDWLCETCADRLTVVCDHCDERIMKKMRSPMMTMYCVTIVLMLIMFAVTIAVVLSTVTEHTGMTATTPIAHPAGTTTMM